MRALFVTTGRLVQPFDDPPGRSQWAEGTLDDAWARTLAKVGAARADVDAGALFDAQDDLLVVADHCFVTEKCVVDFLRLSRAAAGPTRLALARTPSVEYTRPGGSVTVEPFDAQGLGARPAKPWRAEAKATDRCVYDCFYVPKGALAVAAQGAASAGALLDALRERAVRVVVPKREIGIPVRLPVLGDASRATLSLPVTSTWAAHVEHWVHVLWTNHLAASTRFLEIARERKAWAALRAVAAGWPSLPRLMSSFVVKGRSVRIHKTAHVEASILGDGVVVGPRATIRNSVIGAHAEVGDHAVVLGSTIGARAYVTPRTFIVWSTIYEEAVIANLKLQVSVIGRGAATNFWAGMIDAKFQGSIEVRKDGALVSTERSFLGSALGHGAYVGAKVLLHPGRELPNGAYVTMRPDELVTEVPADMPPGVPHVRDRGTLVPLQGLLPPRA